MQHVPWERGEGQRKMISFCFVGNKEADPLVRRKSSLWGDCLPILFITGTMWEKQQVHGTNAGYPSCLRITLDVRVMKRFEGRHPGRHQMRGGKARS